MMDAVSKNIRTLKRLDWYFIVLGMIEIFILVFLTANFLGIIPGLITLVPAYIGMIEKKINWNYFVGIWVIVKYNPITAIAMLAFILGDFFKVYRIMENPENSMNSKIVIIFAIFICILLFLLTSFVLGIILIVKTAKHNKLKKQEQLIF
jgi:hypothetical protein